MYTEQNSQKHSSQQQFISHSQQFISLSRDVYTSIYKTDENMSDYVY